MFPFDDVIMKIWNNLIQNGVSGMQIIQTELQFIFALIQCFYILVAPVMTWACYQSNTMDIQKFNLALQTTKIPNK